MHRSRLFGVFIDAPVDEAPQATAFWAGALGASPVPDPGDGDYTRLDGHGVDLRIEVQAVNDTARYHVDIETDDVTAEANRLLALGATIVGRPEGWVVLQAPGGHLLCVVPVHSSPAVFAERARTWGVDDQALALGTDTHPAAAAQAHADGQAQGQDKRQDKDDRAGAGDVEPLAGTA